MTDTRSRHIQLAVGEHRALQPNTRSLESLALAFVNGHCIRYTHTKLLAAPLTRVAAEIGRLSQNTWNKYVNASVLVWLPCTSANIGLTLVVLERKSLIRKYKSGNDAVSAFEIYYTLFRNATRIKQNIVCRVPAVNYKI